MGEETFTAAVSAVDSVNALLDELERGVDCLTHSEFWKLGSQELLDVGRRMETLARTHWAGQIAVVGELDQQGVAATRSVSSTAVLARVAFGISAGEAGARLAAARATLPQDLLSGGERPAGPTVPGCGGGCR